jgi:hypothetical protein
MALEDVMRDSGDPIELRDPHGNGLHNILLRRFHGQGWEFEYPSLASDARALPVDERRFCSKDELARHAPLVEMDLIFNHFQSLTYGANSSCPLGGKLQDAVHNLAQVRCMPRLMCHIIGEYVDVVIMDGAAQPSHTKHGAFFCMSAEVSQRSRPYKVWMYCVVPKLDCWRITPDLHPRILKAGCECPAGKGTDYVHVAMTLMAIHLLPRPGNLGVCVPVTSKIYK